MKMLELLTFTKQYIILSFFYPRLSYNCLGRRRKCCSPETCEQAIKKCCDYFDLPRKMWMYVFFMYELGDLLQGSWDLE